MDSKKILVIEDEIPIADLLCYGLKKYGFQCIAANSGSRGLEIIEEFNPDLILLDWMLPDISGIDVCKIVTEKNKIPIIMLTAKSDIEDRVLGLEFGADDYISKPFDMREVAARIKTVFRRIGIADNTLEEQNKKIRFKDIEIIEIEHVVKKNGEIVDLTPKEYDLLILLYENKGRAFTRDQLLESIWGYEFLGDTRTVDIHIQRLRKKLDLSDLIKTVFGIGYKFIK